MNTNYCERMTRTRFARLWWRDYCRTRRTRLVAALSLFASLACDGLAAPWMDQDIGNVGAAGSAVFSNGTFTVEGSGVDIWDYQDGFHFVYQPLNGDGAIVARVAGLSNTDPWAKAGVMIRQSTDPGCPCAMMALTPGNGATFQYRVSPNDLSYYTNQSGTAPPYWVKLARSANALTGYKSGDGLTWVRVGSATIPMSSAASIGLAVTAHNYGVLNTATFDQVQVLEVLPTITAFQVTPATAPSGAPFTINYTVADDGGPGLAQVQLRRASGDGTGPDPTWTTIQTTPTSGSGPVSGSFTDAPPATGTYWYGLHAVDTAGSFMDERTAGVGRPSK